MSDCIFCKIIKKEIPANIVYENDKVIAFLDIRPINTGHMLVVPKTHNVNLLDTPEDILCELAIATKKISAAVIKAVGAQGFNIGMNNGKAAGQLVMHAHLHIIPRFPNDGLRHWPGKESSKEELEAIAKEIVKLL
ncbi:MAG: HIT family protein [Candidatus Woesearchaeota archaeon]